MNEFTCTCGRQYIVGKKKVYKPIAHLPSDMMSREQFEDDYADCAHAYDIARRKVRSMADGHTTTCTCSNKRQPHEKK